MSGQSTPLPILTEEDLAALPPTPPSSSPSSAPSEGTTAAEDEFEGQGREEEEEKTDVSTPLDTFTPPSNEEDAVSAHDAEDSTDFAAEVERALNGEALASSDVAEDPEATQSPVDAPLVMPDLPPPPSSTSPSTVASSPSPSSFAAFRLEDPTLPPPPAMPVPVAAVRGENNEEEEEASVDAPTVVDSAASSPDRHGSEDAATTTQAIEDVATTAVAMPEAEGDDSEEAIDESLRASEAAATAALHRFRSSLHAKLVEQLIDDAAAAVEQTLHDTIQQHGSRVRALVAHNRALDARLSTQAAQMTTAQGEWEAAILRDVERVLRVDVRAVLRQRQSGTTDEGSPATENEEEAGQEGFSAAPSGGNSSPSPPPVSVEELVAAYLGTRGTVETLQHERAAWRRNVSALQTSLLAATRENASLRHEVEHLRTTTVDLDIHRGVVQRCEEAEHQRELLQLQLDKQAEEAEVLVAMIEQQSLTQQQEASGNGDGSSAATAAATAPPSADEEERAQGVRKGPMWDMAMRELEEQATIAANSHHLREQLAAAEAEQRRLQSERDASVAYAAALKEEGDVLRADAQSMTFRNGVLSQQLASLLVKLENTARAYRHLKASRASGTSSTEEATTASASASPPSSLLRSLPTASSQRSKWLASMWPSANATAALPDTSQHHYQQQQRPSPPYSSSSAYTYGTGRALNTAMLYDRPPSSDIQQLLHMPAASADVSFLRAPVEVEEGLQQRLSTYAASHVAVPAPLLSSAAANFPHQRLLRRSRQTTLRQLGSATLEVSLTAAPRLPASDQLSGSALGRPSTYSTLDPVQGTVSRRVGGTEVSVATGVSSARTSGTSMIASAEDVNADPQLLCRLDTLDKDESLDRFSVNSVSELVVRNQELVKQLYEVTQRAEAAEKDHNEAVVDAARAESTATAPGSFHLPASLTTPAAALLQRAESAAAAGHHTSTEARPSRKRDREAGDDVDAPFAAKDTKAGTALQPQHHHQHQRGSLGLVESEHAADSASATQQTTEVTEDAATAPWFTDSASEAVSSMVDALVRRHAVRLTAVDSATSRALLRALAAQREADNAVRATDALDTSIPQGGGSGDAAMAVCLRSLLQLCVRQSATLAEVALNAADQQQEMQQAVTQTWTAVQETLLRALQTSQAALAPPTNTTSSSSSRNTETLVASALYDTRTSQRARPEAGDASADTVMTMEDRVLAPERRHETEFRIEDQAALLQELSALLQTAAKKDGTLLHVYQAAQARQEARQRQEKERLARLLLKLERKRRLIKAMRLHQTHGSAPAGTLEAARGLSVAGQDVDMTQTSAAVPNPTPQVGSPVYRTPPLPPMSLPSTTTATNAQGSPQLRHTQSSRHTDHDDGSSNNNNSRRSDASSNDDDSEDTDDEALTTDIFRELQQQLALSQASHRAVQKELDDEKERHTSLLERMWVLEAARDDAAAAHAALETQLQATVPREAYESVAADLAASKAEAQSLEAQLSDAAATQKDLQAQLTALKAQQEAERLQLKTQYGSLEELARRREQRLLVEEGRYRDLQAQSMDVRQHAAGLENAIALARREVQEKAQVIQEKEAMMEELKMRLLTRDDVQALLCRLYPDHTVLQANANLVRQLGQTTTRLELEVTTLRQDLAHAREELRQQASQLREAVQDRQAAEVRLQDAVVRLAELQEGEGESSESAAAMMSPTSAAVEALFDVESASVASLRQRVRSLATRLEAQAADLALLREAEAAWKAREDHLRRQLDVMSTDPISLTARKYGLKACESFTAQVAEMQAKLDALAHALAAAEAEKTALAGQLENTEKTAAAADRRQAELEESVRSVETQLAAAQAESEARKSALAALESQLRASESTSESLQQQHQQTLSALEAKAASLRELQTSLDACRAQRDQFLTDNKQMIDAVESLKKALLQSEAEKVMAREALAQGLSASSSRRQRGGGGGHHRGSAMDRYRGDTSLTQDLSFSSLAP